MNILLKIVSLGLLLLGVAVVIVLVVIGKPGDTIYSNYALSAGIFFLGSIAAGNLTRIIK